MTPGTWTRWTIILVGALLLAGDVLQDLAYWKSSFGDHSLWMAAAILVRNLLLLAALVGLAARQPWGMTALLLSAILGLARRGLFMWGALSAFHGRWIQQPEAVLGLAGADLLFRIVVLAVLLDWMGQMAGKKHKL